MSHETFIDWVTIAQYHPEGGLPIITGGLTVHYSSDGVPIFERNKPTQFRGSHASSVSVGCDGFRVYLSGNPGRLSRKDNLFNHTLQGTIEACNRVLLAVALPPFTVGDNYREASAGRDFPSGRRGAVFSRLDITRNYATGSPGNSRAFIRWLTQRSIARMKRGQAGDESVWWVNTRHMLKAYVKHLEMIKHGFSADDTLVQWVEKQGVVRVEIELKRRLLQELGLRDLDNITDEKLWALFDDQIEPFKRSDHSGEEDILEHIPQRSRAIAAAWLSGHDVRQLASRATVFRHAKVLRECGLDILAARNLEKFPVRVRFIDLIALEKPDWYSLDEDIAL